VVFFFFLIQGRNFGKVPSSSDLKEVYRAEELYLLGTVLIPCAPPILLRATVLSYSILNLCLHQFQPSGFIKVTKKTIYTHQWQSPLYKFLAVKLMFHFSQEGEVRYITLASSTSPPFDGEKFLLFIDQY